jgi:hypothetical protein
MLGVWAVREVTAHTKNVTHPCITRITAAWKGEIIGMAAISLTAQTSDIHPSKTLFMIRTVPH